MDQLTLLIQSIHQFQELVLQFDAGNAEFERSKVVSNKAAIYFSAAEFTNQFRNLCAATVYSQNGHWSGTIKEYVLL